MTCRRPLVAIVLLAAALHAIGMARSILPAQDGLKFLRIARQFQTRPWVDVVRDADQHPLYPALVALAEPMFALVLGRGPETWRLAAQGVSASAAVALLFPLFGLARALFDGRIALLAVLIFVMLPLPGAVGHDTLSDSLALLGFVSALRLGQVALQSPGWRASTACGIAAGLGFLARPEVLVAPAAVFLASASPWRLTLSPRERVAFGKLSALAISFLVMVGGYALIKGEVSEKLALRRAAGLTAPSQSTRTKGHPLPGGLGDPRWDFSPKEESEEPSGAGPASILRLVVVQWAEWMAGVFAFFAVWGLVRDRSIRARLGGDDPGRAERWSGGRRLIVVYLVLFAAVLVRHAMRMGYVSGRHTLTLVIVSVPWAAAGIWVCSSRLAEKLAWSDRRARAIGVSAIAVAVGIAVAIQVAPGHPSRWGHWAAGHWLKAHAAPEDAVLDTRGWAAFVSGRPSYDYWHVRQSLTDSRLAYVVVGADEIEAPSRRAATLRALLAFAATPCADFPERPGDREVGVRVYRFRRPDSWEGFTP